MPRPTTPPTTVAVLILAALAAVLSLAPGASAVDVHDEALYLTVDNTTAGDETLITFRSVGAGGGDDTQFAQNEVEGVTLKLCRSRYSRGDFGADHQACYDGRAFRNDSRYVWMDQGDVSCLEGDQTLGNAACWVRTTWPENATSEGAYTLSVVVEVFHGVDFPTTYLGDALAVNLEQPVSTSAAGPVGSETSRAGGVSAVGAVLAGLALVGAAAAGRATS